MGGLPRNWFQIGARLSGMLRDAREIQGRIVLAGLLMAVSLAGCSGASPSPSTASSPITSAAATPAASPTPMPTPSPTPVPGFVATGSMKDERIDATATLLADGEVLVAGGSPALCDLAGCPVLASAELYDPASGKFTPTGSMVWARVGASATLLPDGRVLIVGGYGCLARKCTDDDSNNVLTATAELYDPATGKFAPTGSMSAVRSWATATALPDGRVLILNGGTQLAEIYDPATGKFTRDGSLRNGYGSPESVVEVAVDSGTATLLPNGKVLVVGRVGDGSAAELFDPATGKSASVAFALPKDPASKHDYDQIPQTASLLKGGRVLVYVWDSPQQYMESDPPYSESALLVSYDSATTAFSQPTWISSPSRWLLAKTTSLPDGSVLFTGGELGPNDRGDSNPTAAAGLYDPAAGFRLIGSMTQARAGQTATLLPDGWVLIAGGIDEQKYAVSSAELFKP
jgi:hypothetical protein